MGGLVCLLGGANLLPIQDGSAVALVKDVALSINNDGMGDTAGIGGGGELLSGNGTNVQAGEAGVVVLDVALGGLGCAVAADKDDFNLIGLHLGVLSKDFGHDGSAGATPRGRVNVDVILGISHGLAGEERCAVDVGGYSGRSFCRCRSGFFSSIDGGYRKKCSHGSNVMFHAFHRSVEYTLFFGMERIKCALCVIFLLW